MQDAARSATDALAQGDWERAEELLAGALARAAEADRPALCAWYGEVLANLGRYADADGALGEAKQYGDALARARATVARAEVAIERWERARVAELVADAHALALGTGDPALIARALRAAAREAVTAGEYAKADELCAEALVAAEGLPRDDLAVAAALDVLCTLRVAQGDIHAAADAARDALAMRERLLPSDHPLRAESLAQVARCAFANDDHAGALEGYEQALAIVRERLGENHPRAGILLHSIADVHEEAGRYSEAARTYDSALAILEAAFGPEHPEVGKALGCRAWHDKHAGDLHRAAKAYERAVAILSAALGPEHPETLQVVGDFGSTLGDLGDYAEAERLYRQVLEARRLRLGDDHPAVAESLHNLGWLCAQVGRTTDAEAAYREALRIRELAGGPESLPVASTLNDLGWTLHTMGRQEEAEAALLRALAIQRRLLAPGHVDIAITLDNLGAVYAAQERWAKSAEAALEALEIECAVLGASHPHVATTLGNLATVLAMVDPMESLHLAERAVELYERALGPAHPDTARARVQFVRALIAVGQFSDAPSQATLALLALEAALGRDHAEVVDALHLAAAAALLAGDEERARASIADALLRERDSGRNDAERLAELEFFASAIGDDGAQPPAPAVEHAPERPDAELRQVAEHPERWDALTPQELVHLALAETGRFAAGEADRLPVARQLYTRVVARMPAGERLETLQGVTAALVAHHGPATLLLPFLLDDPDPAIISTAALDFALLTRPVGDDLLTGPRSLRQFAERAPDPGRRAAILSGLLLLGDRRVLPILRGCWELLEEDAEATRTLVNARSHWTSACQVWFLLDWLEALLDREDEGAFGLVASGLVNIARRGDVIQDVARVFPVWAAEEDSLIVLGTWSVAEFGREIEPRLRAIDAREPDPKVTPFVIAAWGLRP